MMSRTETPGPTGLALLSLRHRTTAFLATFTTVLLGTALMGSFATLVETSAASGVSDVDAETLTIMGAVVGGWGALIVLFAVASTVGITVRGRAVEIGLLRTIGSTPRQARRMLDREVLVVAVVAALGGALLAWPGGAALLAMLRSGGLVAESVGYAGGPASLTVTAAVVLAVSMVAARVAGHRAVRGPAALAVAAGRSGAGRMRWWRVALGLLLVGYGVGMGVVTITVTAHSDEPYAAMQTSGSAGIVVAIGLAVLAPVVLRMLAVPVRPLLGRGPAAHLAAYNATRRAHELAAVLAPVIVLTASAIGVLMVVGIDERTLVGVPSEEQDTINLLNNVVTGMICVFAAIMVVNAFAAAVADRRLELHRLHLLGATPAQVRGSVRAESAIVAVVGVLAGTLASLASVVPFAIAREEGPVPDGQLWLPPLVVVGVTVLTLAAAAGAVRRTTAAPVR